MVPLQLLQRRELPPRRRLLPLPLPPPLQLPLLLQLRLRLVPTRAQTKLFPRAPPACGPYACRQTPCRRRQIPLLQTTTATASVRQSGVTAKSTLPTGCDDAMAPSGAAATAESGGTPSAPMTWASARTMTVPASRAPPPEGRQAQRTTPASTHGAPWCWVDLHGRAAVTAVSRLAVQVHLQHSRTATAGGRCVETSLLRQTAPLAAGSERRCSGRTSRRQTVCCMAPG